MVQRRANPLRPTDTYELAALVGVLFSNEAAQRGLAFEPDASDVIISPHAKCGTTYLQQIAHTLRTRGSMDFADISEVTPWIEVAHTLGQDLDARQVARPRVFKSHVSWHDVPKGARYIVSFRHPRTAFESLYRFFSGFLFEPGSIDIETLFRWRFPPERPDTWRYWEHLASWWGRRHDPAVLLFCYEDMILEPERTIRSVADHMGIDVDEELLEIVLERSSRSFMLAHSHQFDEEPLRRYAADCGILPYDVEASKVTSGEESSDATLPPHLVEEIDATWDEQMRARYGFESYEDLRAAVANHEAGGNPVR